MGDDGADGTADPLRLTLALMGKGGVGKSALAGTLCRLLAARGHRVLALDVDTVPGFALSLGLPEGGGRLPPGLAEVVQGPKGRRWKFVAGAGPARLVDRYAVTAPGGVRFMELGKLPDGVKPATTMAFRRVVDGFKRPGWTKVADLAAGTRQPFYGWGRFARVRLVVTEPTAKAMLSARRIAPMGTHVVVNKVRTPEHVEAVRRMVPLPLIAAIPYDERLAEAEKRGFAPVDFERSPAVEAADELARVLEELR